MEEPNRNTPERQRERRAAFVNKTALSLGQVGPFLMDVNGQYRSFEFHGVCGPVLLDSKGNPLSKQPGPTSDFWPAFDAWRKAGCHVDPHNRAFVPSQRVLAATTKGGPQDG